jgi:hypothetical protein
VWNDGEPRVVAIPGALAAAGIAYPLPGVVKFKPLALSFVLVTAAGGGNRQVLAGLKDSSGAVVFAVAAPAVQAGGLTVVYSFSADTTAFGTAALGHMGAPFLDSEVPQNLDVFVTVTTTQAADALSGIRLLVKQWPRVHAEHEHEHGHAHAAA